MSWYWDGNKWLRGEQASGITWAAKKTPKEHWPQVTWNFIGSIQYLKAWEGFFPQNSNNFLKDKDDLQVKKVATVLLKKF